MKPTFNLSLLLSVVVLLALGAGAQATEFTLTLVDEANSPLAYYPPPGDARNLQARYRNGGSWAPWQSFTTDGAGEFTVVIDPAHTKWDGKVTVRLHQTSLEQPVTNAGPNLFEAAKVNVNLKSCTGPIADVPGGSVAQGGGYWWTHGTTGATGTVTFYTFPGTIKVRMQYNHGSQTEDSVPIIAGTNEVDFQTTKVTLNYGDDIRSNKGGSWWMFSKPSMDLLPGDENIWFKNNGKWGDPVLVAVSGCEMNKAMLRVLDEDGNGMAGGKGAPAIGGSWQPAIAGETDASGLLFVDYDPAWTKIKMTVNQGSQEQTAAQLTASNYTWTTQILRIWLLDHAGSVITDEQAVLSQGGGTWVTWGNLNASGYRDVQLFPGSYRFRMTYNHTSETKDGVPVVAGPGYDDFYFQTGQVFGSCITEYTGAGWSTFTNGMELMPGTYTFRYPSQSGTVVAGGTTNLTCP